MPPQPPLIPGQSPIGVGGLHPQQLFSLNPEQLSNLAMNQLPFNPAASPEDSVSSSADLSVSDHPEPVEPRTSTPSSTAPRKAVKRPLDVDNLIEKHSPKQAKRPSSQVSVVPKEFIYLKQFLYYCLQNDLESDSDKLSNSAASMLVQQQVSANGALDMNLLMALALKHRADEQQQQSALEDLMRNFGSGALQNTGIVSPQPAPSSSSASNSPPGSLPLSNLPNPALLNSLISQAGLLPSMPTSNASANILSSFAAAAAASQNNSNGNSFPSALQHLQATLFAK